MIEVVDYTDDICAPCPHRRETQCETQEKIVRLDQAHAAMLGLHPGEVISWKIAIKKITEQVTLEKFHQACAPCEWKTLGICEKRILAAKSL